MSGRTWSYPAAIRQRRPHSASYIGCAKSIWHLHDETVNIWTHLIAFAIFCTAYFRVYIRHRRKWTDGVCAQSLYLPAASCFFLCSTLYHTFANHDNATYWQCLDHCGITAFMWASSRSFTILAYGHQRTAARQYVVVLTATALLLVFWSLYNIATWNSQIRIAYHAGYGAFAALPAFSHPSSLHWRTTRGRQKLLGNFRALVLISAMGGILYAMKCIERMIDAKADWGDVDHHAMHMAVVIGACIYGCELLCEDFA
ncbi:hemolysin-III related-domain-containing protein [Paraphoma chrysanthemicola]|nr:hemolysin-III related-domain-containing protein [Paraphoma chrysanthemicola]KAH7061842.1 hemolysin-III related-domain-containing protein [Paraphoma chrysanthemicola]